MADRLGVGFVGAGFMTNFHLLSWRGVRHGDIRGILDPDSKRARATAGRCRDLRVGHPKTYSDVKEMVADPDIHAIWICSPNYTRLQVMEKIAAAIKAGEGTLKGVACEKPLARNAAEAQTRPHRCHWRDL